MRASIGFIVRLQNDTVEEHFTKKGYKVKLLPSVEAIRSDFPLKFYWGMIIVLAAKKVYPVLSKQLGLCLKERKTSPPRCSIEIYNPGLKRIEFYFPLDQVDDFYLTDKPAP